jgi:SSS family solute:Na+ symporter
LARRSGSEKSSADFFLAGRRMSWPIIGASLFATNIGAEHLVGLSGDAYRYGLSAGVNELNALISLGIAAAILYPHYLRNRVYTIGEFLEIRYNPAARLVLSGFMICVSIMTKMAFTLFAGALVLHSLLPQWDVMEVVCALGLMAAVITILGGFAAVAYTDTIQTVIMIGGCFIMTVIGLAPHPVRHPQQMRDPGRSFGLRCNGHWPGGRVRGGSGRCADEEPTNGPADVSPYCTPNGLLISCTAACGARS